MTTIARIVVLGVLAVGVLSVSREGFSAQEAVDETTDVSVVSEPQSDPAAEAQLLQDLLSQLTPQQRTGFEALQQFPPADAFAEALRRRAAELAPVGATPDVREEAGLGE